MHVALGDNCTGCMECKYACPQDAISFVTDSEGFLYPSVNEEKCVNCGKCLSKCAALNVQKHKEPVVFAARNRDNAQLHISSSGGVFPAICNYFFSQRGKVYATAFDEKFNVAFRCATTLNEAKCMFGSKYVQSYISDYYDQIKNDAESGCMIAIVGTPCQINGIKNYLGKDYLNVYLIDLVCHGVPSPQLWKDYRDYLIAKHHGPINAINFRDKSSSWKHSSAYAVVGNNKVSAQEYMNLYGEASMMRPSCYSCLFASIDRISDLTIGDFWGIEDISRTWFDDKLGTSIIMSNTDKADQLIVELDKWLVYESFGRIQVNQMNLSRSTARPPKRDQFWSLYYKSGFSAVLIRYGGAGAYGYIRKRLGKVKRILLSLVKSGKGMSRK